MSHKSSEDLYQNDQLLIEAYNDAMSLNDKGLKTLCPSYIELSEVTTRYQNKELLGQGGVKKVYRAFDNNTRRWIAMACLREDRGPEFYDIFVHEAWLTSSLNHPNIINIHDVGIASSANPYFTMDLKGNTTLADLIDGDHKDQRALLRVFLKICEAISFAHSQDIIHLDLKPENIQADTYGEVLVCDWGLGKVISDIDEDPLVAPSTSVLDNMTLVGEIKGTPGYMAPEQIIKNAKKDHRSDVFALGCILHAILTGEPPFQGDTKSRIESTITDDISNPCEQFSSLKIPPSLGAVTMKALAKSPEDRYQSITLLQEDVQSYMDGFSTDAEDSSFLREASLFVSRNRAPVAVAFLSLILLSVLSTIFIQRLDFLHQSVIEESQLADQYAAEAEVANKLHLDSLADSKEDKLILSNTLMSSIRTLKSKGVYATPMKSIRQALKLAELAHSLDPDSKSAQYEIFALNLIQLNFKRALEFPLPKNHNRYGYMSFAKAYPNFSYHRGKRPTLKKLCDFLENARKLDPNHGPMIERIISYDAAVRSSKKSYHVVLESLIRYLNPDFKEIELSYNAESLKMILQTPKQLKLISDPADSKKCILRYMKLRTLSIKCPENMNLNELEGLLVKHIDLSECTSFTLTELLNLPFLETVTIPKDSKESKNIRKWIHGSENFKILQH